MLRWISILPIMLCIIFAQAEGTKELRPTAADWGNIEINDQGRPFALESNTDSLHRLYIHVKDITETIYFGFQPNDKTLGTGTFRIKDPSGTVVYARTDIPVATGAGYIEDYNEAVAGPNIGGATPTGYTPLSFSPASTGDFYIEFTQSLGAGTTYHFDLFDITVADATGTPITGRLWSYAWDLSARGGTNAMESIFYVYTADKYITSVDLNGIQPFGFVIACNSTGTGNTGVANTDRQSVDGNSTYPEYKLFLNLPDTTVYEIAEPPIMVQDLAVLGSPNKESDVLFYLNMDKAGSLEIFLDLDGVSGYQSGGADVLLVEYIQAGGDTIIWDGRNGLGAWAQDTIIVGVSSRFATGVTHLPLYDPEYHPNGFIVNRILPNASRADLYWDDTPLTGGASEFEGVNGDTNGHNFPAATGGYGNLRTINTWWNGFENNDLKSFSFALNGTLLPITLSYWNVKDKGEYVLCSWITATETNNNYFDIERSSNGQNWNTISTVFGAGNSSSFIHYNEIDITPINGNSYYRLKQVDFNGKMSFSNIISLERLSSYDSNIKVYTNNVLETLTLEDEVIDLDEISIINIQGQSVLNQVVMNINELSKITFSLSNLPFGNYIVYYKDKPYIIQKK